MLIVPLIAASLIGGGASVLSSFLGNRKSRGQKELENLSRSDFTGYPLQKFLPPELRFQKTGPIIASGLEGIGQLIRNPGQLAPGTEGAIRQRLGIESEGIASNFRGIRAEQAGMAARTNLPVSIKSALASALDVAQERAQRGARREALIDTDQLRRQDLAQTYALLDVILQFMSSARGQTIPGLAAVGNSDTQRRAALLASLGSTAQGLSTLAMQQQNPGSGAVDRTTGGIVSPGGTVSM